MCMACNTTIDPNAVETFGGRLLDIVNNAGLAMMISIGHRTGLFDTMSDMEAATSRDISARAGLNDRYVREWLGAMVTGHIVVYDDVLQTYFLPQEHAALLTRTAEQNMASTMQWISVLGAVESKIVTCFRAGGGVAYSSYPRFHEVMADQSEQTVVAGLVDHILPLVDGLRERLEAGIDVLDVGCGSGQALNFLAAEFPESRFVGYDVSREAIAAAREEAVRQVLPNTRFVVNNVAEIEDIDAFDLITAFDAIHDQAYPADVLSGISQALRPNGLFLMQDIAASSRLENNVGSPLSPFLYTISCMHCMAVSLSQGGAGLGTVWGRELATEMLQEAGFINVEIDSLPHDALNEYYLARK